ncbi:type II secretion system F family protein [Aquimonas voraii]|uniref:General secretion pathway protein F n=1 Tax=Aquimonas voraii TaxID=265719 RepID=A0A1G6SNW8_9GAMM|nr:type II secretion system F family protein [Aquimonas voraii]SDD18523.1 general secretion pathway protein F [Aquimonas voraii]
MPARALPEDLRARLHLQLATLERAGIAPLQALDALDLGPEAAQRLRSARGFLMQGQPLAQAGRLAGLFTPLEAAVIAAASQGGSPAGAHQRLGEQALLLAQQGKTLRGRLLLPGFVALAALLILPLPSVVAGSLSVAAYLLRVILVVAGVAALFALGRELLRRHAAAEDWPGRVALESLSLGLPVLGPLIARLQVQRFLEYLALLLDCGLPAAEAVRHAASTLRVQPIRSDFEASVPALLAGHSLHAVAGGWRFVADPMLAGLIATGEGSGRLPELLARYANAEGEALESRIDSLATWIPRIVYLLLALLLAWQLVGGFGALLGRDIG